jgi:hypothetical protein
LRRRQNQAGAYPPDPMEWNVGAPTLGLTRLLWFTLGFIAGILLIVGIGIYIGPAKGRVWVDPPAVLR